MPDSYCLRDADGEWWVSQDGPDGGFRLWGSGWRVTSDFVISEYGINSKEARDA